MSNCFCCGKELPEGQVECDPPCNQPPADTLPPDLAAEIAAAERACKALVHHVARMGAGGFHATVILDKYAYSIQIRRSDYQFPDSASPTPQSPL